MDLTGKKILLLAPPFYDLHKQIIAELKTQGASVDYVEDIAIKYCPYFVGDKVSIKIKEIYYDIFKPDVKRIKRIEFFNNYYDYFFCVNGFSFHKLALSKLKKQNNKIISILYLWDGLSYFNFKRNFSCFDKIFTFDYKDAQQKKINYLPLFWVPFSINEKTKCKNDVFFVGSMHSDRYTVLTKLVDFFDNNNINYYIKLVVTPFKQSFLDRVKIIFLKSHGNDAINSKVAKGKIKNKILTRENINRNDFDENMLASRCVIDIEFPYQTGISNRMILALAMNKKIISTNQHIMDDPLVVDNRNILIIDRENPIVPLDFIQTDNINISSDKIMQVRIDNWIKYLFI